MPLATVPTAFVEKFNADFILLSQQKQSRLERTVRRDPDMLMGRFGYYDRIGSLEMSKRTSRHQDTILSEPPHSRRRISLQDFELAIPLDKQDLIRMQADPTGKYQQLALAAANRKKDELIIACMDTSAYAIDEDNAATQVALPAGNIIAAGGTGFTLAKWLQAKEIHDGYEVDEEIQRFLVVSSKQVTNMFNTTEIKSADYNTVKALAEGKVNDFLGYQVIRSEKLKKTGNERRALFYAGNAAGIAIGEDTTIDIGPRRDKGNMQQMLITLSADTTRIEDEKVVVADCVET